MKNVTSYLLVAALLTSPALFAQDTGQQQPNEGQTEQQLNEQRPQETQPELGEPIPTPEPRRADTPEVGDEPVEGAPEQPSGAAESPTSATEGSMFIEQESAEQVLASNLLGYSVTNLQGENIGQVEDLILDQNMQPVGLVIATGGFLGLGAKHVGLPMSEVQIDRENKIVQVNLTKEEFNKAPPFTVQKEEQNGRKEGESGGGMSGQ